MKKLSTLLLLLLFAVFIGQAQTAKKGEAKSNAEKFSAKSGTLIQKEFIDVGSNKGLEVQVVVYTDLMSKASISAVRFEYDYVGKYSNDTKIASLDEDEIDGLIKSLKIMKNKIFPSIPQNYTEITFQSRGDFVAGCFWSTDHWALFFKLDKYDGDSYVFFKDDDIQTLLSLLEKAKKML